MFKKTHRLELCGKCTIKIVDDLQDHERLIIKNPAYARGECQICYGVLCFIVTVQQDTFDWIRKFTFNESIAVQTTITPQEGRQA